MKRPSRDHFGLVSFLSFVNVSCRVVRSPPIERHEIDVGLTASRLPVGGAQRVEHRLAVGADVLPGDLPHVLRVEEGHRTLRGCGRGDECDEREDEERRRSAFHGGSSEKSGF